MAKTEQSRQAADVELHASRPPVRWGIVGSGHIARRFAQGLSCVADARLSGVWTRRDVQAQAFARRYEARACPCFDELLNDIDALDIATLPDGRAHYARRAISGGRAILCEKPAAPSAGGLGRCWMRPRRQGGSS